MRANFLDISKAFDKVWHEGLLFKLGHIGMSGKSSKSAYMFLSNRFQQVELNGQCFSWSSGPAGVQHSSILGQLLFLYVNDLPDSLQFGAKLF